MQRLLFCVSRGRRLSTITFEYQVCVEVSFRFYILWPEMTKVDLQDVRLNILEAHEAFQAAVASSVRAYVTFHNTKDIICASDEANNASNISKGEAELNFVEIAALWQAPLYELSFTENGITG